MRTPVYVSQQSQDAGCGIGFGGGVSYGTNNYKRSRVVEVEKRKIGRRVIAHWLKDDAKRPECREHLFT